MIVYRFWTTKKRGLFGRRERLWDGWFLLGIIPLFVRLVKEVER